MNDDLTAAVSSVEARLTAEQWADALWLAKFLPQRRRIEAPADTVPRQTEPSEPKTGRTQRSTTGPESRPIADHGEPQPNAATLHLPAGSAQRPALTPSGPIVQVPSVAALPGSLALLRSLRAIGGRALGTIRA